MRIALIVTWFGTWPIWFPAFLRSCELNPSIDWFIFTDCPQPQGFHADNVRFLPITIDEFNHLASQKIGRTIKLPNAYKLCDYKPAYGLIFEDYIYDFDFWGHCDVDVIWGNIRKFITEDLLSEYTIISSRRNILSGHFCLYKNKDKINRLFQTFPDYYEVLTDPKYRSLDEVLLSRHLKEARSQGNSETINIHWPRRLVTDWPQLANDFVGWRWVDGKLFDIEGNESFYVHFMKWKKTIQTVDFGYSDRPSDFSITPLGMWHRQMSVADTIRLYLFDWSFSDSSNGGRVLNQLRQLKRLLRRIMRRYRTLRS